MSHLRLTIGQCATLACLLEATAPKPGNVHRGADFEDLKFTDFVASAVAIGPVMERAQMLGVGPTVLAAIEATRRVAGSNTNLGTVLLLAPLAAVAGDQPLDGGVAKILAQLGPQDSQSVYRAIQLARPGGMGSVDEMDIQAAPPDDLLVAMQAASDRDLVAREYVTGFAIVLGVAAADLQAGIGQGWTLTNSILHTQMRLMSEYPDSLIARKCGIDVARQSSHRAAGVLAAGPPDSPEFVQALGDLDFWLRCDGHRRNPGTTADLIAAGLFASLRDNRIQPPFD